VKGAPEMVAVSFDASEYVERKLLALTAHRSAFGVTPAMLASPPEAMVMPNTPGTAQVVLAVTDNGTPSLTSYRRVILTIQNPGR
jgi:LmbE family N-acetylglucosaminyl deacetylase